MRNTMFSLLWILLCGQPGCGDSKDDTNDAHVGSRDCKVITAASPDPATGEACTKCQNKACGTVGCELFPCVDSAIVVQGCNEDADCSGLPDAPFCGMHSAPDKVCVNQDDV